MQPPGASHHHHIFLQILQVFLFCLVAEASSNAIAQITAKHFHGPAFPSIPLHVPWTLNLSITPYCCPLPFLALSHVSLRDMVTHHSSAIFIALQHLLINTRKHHHSLRSRTAWTISRAGSTSIQALVSKGSTSNCWQPMFIAGMEIFTCEGRDLGCLQPHSLL